MIGALRQAAVRERRVVDKNLASIFGIVTVLVAYLSGYMGHLNRNSFSMLLLI